ncbi:MAG: alpha/beta fold hydrolase [Chitinophagales bacterium]|nr:alpha/beta fold hydrolase [Chitinophagales bacterium]
MKKRYWFLAILLVIGAAFAIASLPPSYQYVERPLPDNFETFYRQQLLTSQQHGARTNNEEKWLRFSEGKTPLAFLYIHGFTASRGEGEMVVDSLAKLYQANTYYLRLPGHGTNPDDHAQAKFNEFLDCATDALRMMQTQGEKVIIIGTSMGGLIATYLAANYPDMVDGLVLCSPFYDYAGTEGKALKIPGMLGLVKLLDGPDRTFKRDSLWESQRMDGYDNYWYSKVQRYNALYSLENLRKYAAGRTYYKKVKAPVAMLYYYKDEKHQDPTASVKAMLNAFDAFESGIKQKYPIADGNHVLTSAYVKSDKAAVINSITQFIAKLN